MSGLLGLASRLIISLTVCLSSKMNVKEKEGCEPDCCKRHTERQYCGFINAHFYINMLLNMPHIHIFSIVVANLRKTYSINPTLLLRKRVCWYRERKAEFEQHSWPPCSLSFLMHAYSCFCIAFWLSVLRGFDVLVFFVVVVVVIQQVLGVKVCSHAHQAERAEQ